MNIDGENIGNTLGNHARLPKQGGQTTACKFDGWLKDWVNERLPKGYDLSATTIDQYRQGLRLQLSPSCHQGGFPHYKARGLQKLAEFLKQRGISFCKFSGAQAAL